MQELTTRCSATLSTTMAPTTPEPPNYDPSCVDDLAQWANHRGDYSCTIKNGLERSCHCPLSRLVLQRRYSSCDARFGLIICTYSFVLLASTAGAGTFLRVLLARKCNPLIRLARMLTCLDSGPPTPTILPDWTIKGDLPPWPKVTYVTILLSYLK